MRDTRNQFLVYLLLCKKCLKAQRFKTTILFCSQVYVQNSGLIWTGDSSPTYMALFGVEPLPKWLLHSCVWSLGAPGFFLSPSIISRTPQELEVHPSWWPLNSRTFSVGAQGSKDECFSDVISEVQQCYFHCCQLVRSLRGAQIQRKGKRHLILMDYIPSATLPKIQKC